MKLHDKAVDLYDYALKHKNIRQYFVVDEEERLQEMITCDWLFNVFGGMYGYGLHERSDNAQIMKQDFMTIEEDTPVSLTAAEAMKRGDDTVYDAIAVTRGGKYAGQVTVRDLLQSFLQEIVQTASYRNPLTRLPGNHAIQTQIRR